MRRRRKRGRESICLSVVPFSCVLAEEDLGEGAAEVGTEYGVDERVKEWVEVAEPQQDSDKRRARQIGSIRALLADAEEQLHGEEGKPADDEAAHYDAKL